MNVKQHGCIRMRAVNPCMNMERHGSDLSFTTHRISIQVANNQVFTSNLSKMLTARIHKEKAVLSWKRHAEMISQVLIPIFTSAYSENDSQIPTHLSFDIDILLHCLHLFVLHFIVSHTKLVVPVYR